MVRFVKTAQEKFFVLIQWVFLLCLLAAWGAAAIALMAVTVACVFFGVGFAVAPFLGASAFAAVWISLPFVLGRFAAIFKKEAKWVPFDW